MKIEILSNIPIAIKLTIKELPPKLTNGNGVPVRGSIPVIPPKLTTDCKPIIHPIPIAIKLPNGSSHSCAIFSERRTIANTPAIIMNTPMNPNSSETIAIIKSVCGKERSKWLSAINFYITNIPLEYLPKEQVYDFYSLRWQIELIFKTWKSFFRIHHCNSVKLERLECHLYGQLISILLCSSAMFQMRQLLLIKKKRELSEYKAIYIIKDYFSLIYQSLQKDTQELTKILFRLFNLLQKNGRKAHRYEKKTVFDILGVVYNYSMSHNHVA